MTRPLCLAVATALGALLPLAGAPDSGPLFLATTATGPTPPGFLESIGKDWSLTLRGGTPLRVAGADLVALRRAGRPLPSRPTEAQVVLGNGDCIPGQPQRLAGERLHFQAQLGQPQNIVLPLTSVAVVWLGPPRGSEEAASVLRRLAAAQRTRDIVLLRNGDALHGTLVALDRQGLRVEAEGKEVSVDRERVAAVALNTELARTSRPRGPFGHLVLTDGARLSAASALVQDGALQVVLTTGPSVRVPLDRLVALDLRQGRAVYLSDLKPRRYEHQGYLGIAWPLQLDRSVAGGELRLQGSCHDKGLGMHSQARLSYDLAGGYRWFEALVGLDDQTGREGHVRVRVLVDGKLCDPGGEVELTERDPSRSIRVDVQGARTLTLEVLFGRRGDVQDHVNWADARLLR